MVLSEKEARQDWERTVRVQFHGSNLQWWKADWWFLGSGGQAGQGRWGDYKAHKEIYRGSRCVHYCDGDDGFTDVPWTPTLIKLHTWDMGKFVVSPLYCDKLFSQSTHPFTFFQGFGRRFELLPITFFLPSQSPRRDLASRSSGYIWLLYVMHTAWGPPQ